MAEVQPYHETLATWRSIRAAIGELEREVGVMGPASRMLGEPEDDVRRLWPLGDGAGLDVPPEEWFEPIDHA